MFSAGPFVTRNQAGFGFPEKFRLGFANLGAGAVSTAEYFGATPTFTRATAATTILSTGLVASVASGTARSYYSPDGTYLGYLAEGQRINVCQRGEDFANVWTDVGTPTLVAASTTLGVLSLSTLGDDSAAALEGKIQPITFTGDAVKAIAVYVKKDTSTSSVVRLRDTTASADRLLAAITWSGTTPVVTMTTGTDLTGTPVQHAATGVYRLLFATTAVTAANTNSLQLYPATDAALSVANTGTIIIGGIQAEDATFPSSLIQTPASASVTRNADVLDYAFVPSATVFSLLSVYGPASATTAAQIVNGGDNNGRYLTIGATATNASTSNAGQTVTLVTPSFLTNTLKVAVSYDGITQSMCVNGGAITSGASVASYTNTKLSIGNRAGVEQPFGPISSIRYFPQRLSNGALQALTA